MASIEPVESAAPKSSRISSVVSRRETRFLTARVATAASEARAEGAGWDLGRQLCPRGAAARRAAQAL